MAQHYRLAIVSIAAVTDRFALQLKFLWFFINVALLRTVPNGAVQRKAAAGFS